MVYAFGAYGTNNLGDDAIFLGLQKSLPNERVVQVYVNYPSIMDSICYDSINATTFIDKDHLVIGGGGLLHCKHAVEDYIRIAKLAKANGAQVHIRRIGAEGAIPEYAEEIRELFSIVDAASVRSKKSLEYLKDCNVSTKTIKLVQDYAYELVPPKHKVEGIKSYFQHPEWPLIGLVTAGNKGGVEAISYVVSELILAEIGCNIIHIPHSRSYVNQNNDDLITGEQIWTSIGVYHANKQWRYKTSTMPQNPYELFDRYAQVDGIIGYRYHSFIFSRIMKKPLLGVADGDKAKAFFDETKYGTMVSSGVSKEELLLACKEFVLGLKKI